MRQPQTASAPLVADDDLPPPPTTGRIIGGRRPSGWLCRDAGGEFVSVLVRRARLALHVSVPAL